MATKQDVEIASKEIERLNIAEQQVSDIAQLDRVEKDSEFVIFKLVDTNRKGRVYIDGIADVKNPETGLVERARLIVGVPSIWQKDQEKLDPIFVRQNRVSLEFIGKVCRIYKWETTKLLFARLNPNNIESPSAKSGSRLEYFEYNPKKQQEEALKKQMAKIEMVIKAKDMPADKMKKMVVFFGIQLYDELGRMKTEDGLRAELMLKADSDPKTFAKHIDSKEVEISYLVRMAILDSKIDLGGNTGNAAWSGSGGQIGKVPINRKPLEYLTELAMTNSADGRQFLEQLKQNIT
jgi:hypothetical protein